MKDFPDFNHSDKEGAEPKRSAEETILYRRYLLDDLNEDEAALVAERCFTNPTLLERLEAAENELIDDYICDELTERDHSRFEQFYLNSIERLEKVRFARRLRSYLGESQPAATVMPGPRRRVVPLLFAAATVAALIITSASLTYLWRSRAQISQELTMAQARLAVERSEIARLRHQIGQSHDVVVSFALPAPLRSAGVPRLRIPTDATRVRLELQIEGLTQSPTLHVVLRDVARTDIWSQHSLNTPVLAVTLPASILSDGRYEMSIYPIRSGDRAQSVPVIVFSFIATHK